MAQDAHEAPTAGDARSPRSAGDVHPPRPPRDSCAPRLARDARALLREAAASAAAARVTSLVAVTIVAVLCAVVLLTTGRSVGAQNAIVSSIDSEGTRSIVVRAPASSGLDTSVLVRLATAAGVASATAFGPADDVQNARFDGGTRVALRREYTLAVAPTGLGDAAATPLSTSVPPAGHPDPAAASIATPSGSTPPVATPRVATPPVATPHVSAPPIATPPTALASPAAARLLGLADGVGAVVSVASRAEYEVSGRAAVPDELGFLDPMVRVLSRVDPDHPQPVSVLVVVAASSTQVAAVAALVESLLAVVDPAKVTVSTSERLADLRAAVQSQLGDFSRSLTLLVFGVGALMVAAVVHGLVLLRRKDFGRRRALGASRPLIVALLLVQVGLLGAAGAVAGCSAAALVLVGTGDPVPTAGFTLAVGVLAVLTAVAASLPAALVASTRDPLRELRVP